MIFKISCTFTRLTIFNSYDSKTLEFSNWWIKHEAYLPNSIHFVKTVIIMACTKKRIAQEIQTTILTKPMKNKRKLTCDYVDGFTCTESIISGGTVPLNLLQRIIFQRVQ